MTDSDFLPGVAVQHVLGRLAKAGGNEVESGKLASAESSAALAVNCFGWFIPRPELLPPIPSLEEAFPAELVDVEYQARCPWAGGRHPWLDAVIVTASHLIGVESKRFEPFRDKKLVSLSSAYDRLVWGDAMGPYEAMRDRLRSGEATFKYLDVAQLVKHAFGLITDARRTGKRPALVYLFAEPAELAGKAIPAAAFARHREEVAQFDAAVAGAEVSFNAISYREWLARFDGDAAAHALRLTEAFAP